MMANGVIEPHKVREALQNTARDKGPSGCDERYGWGIVDAYAALGVAVQNRVQSLESLAVSVLTTDRHKKPKSSFRSWRPVYVLVTVKVDQAATKGANVNIRVEDTAGNLFNELNGMTNSRGEFYHSIGRLREGAYTVEALVTKLGYELGSNSTTFEVIGLKRPTQRIDHNWSSGKR